MPQKPIQNVLDQLTGITKSSNGHEAKCPAHDDKTASLSISEGDDGRVLLHCHAGCSPIAICQALGMKLGELFPSKSDTGRGEIVATYPYCGRDGVLLYQVVRFKPKDFRVRRPKGDDWEWKLGRMPRVLYRLPELLAADPTEWVFIVEGEKDVDRLRSIGLTATCNPGGAGKWHHVSDVSPLEGRRVAIIPDNDKPDPKTGKRPGIVHANAVALNLRSVAAECRIVELPGDFKDVSVYLDAGGTRETLLQLVESVSVSPIADGAVIVIDTVEHRVIRETVAAMVADLDLYQRSSILVRVIRDAQSGDGILRSKGSPTIQAVPAPSLRERITQVATFVKTNAKGEEVLTHPTGWLVSAIESRAQWSGIRHLIGVSDVPILRVNGSIWQTPGYDDQTGVLFEPLDDVSFPEIHAEAGLDDATESMDALAEIIADFPLESDEHKAAWLAALLTPLARFAFSGPSPMFLIDANVRGAGKSLLAQTIGHVVLGREMPASSYVHDGEEMRKKITSIAIAGDRMILLDNIDGPFGNDSLDRALTSTRWKDRILGKSEEIELPLIPTWYATGNNVQITGDMMRRIVHIRIDCLSEHPEERSGFGHENLLSWVDENRNRLLTAALTILSAFLRRGHLEKLVPFGSFEGWSDVVRQAVVWVGLPDPCLTRKTLAESADTVGDALNQLHDAWAAYDATKHGVVLSTLIASLYGAQQEHGFQADTNADMRAAIENFLGTPPGKTPTARKLGNRLRSVRRRVVNDRYLDMDRDRHERGGAVWRLLGEGRTSELPGLPVQSQEGGVLF